MVGVSGFSRKQPFGYVLRGGGGSRGLQSCFGFWDSVFIWVLDILFYYVKILF